jgi:hypothetical protein
VVGCALGKDDIEKCQTLCDSLSIPLHVR